MHAVALADSFTPISPDFQINVWSLVSVLLAVLAVLGHFRRKPPLDTELVKLNTSIEGLNESVERLTESHEKHIAHATEIDELKQKVKNLELHRESDAQGQRSYIAKNTREIFDRIEESDRAVTGRIDAIKDTLNAEFRDLYRALGKTEGKLERVDA